MFKKIGFLLATILILISCDNKKIEKETLVVSNETHQHNEGDSIELNNGSKWKVVPEMMAHIRNMELDINRFVEAKHTELKDFRQLGASLQKNIDFLTSNCTMDGKAHDELHKWLLPYIEMVDKLNKSKNNDEALHTFEEIKASNKLFNIYFK